MEPIRQIFDDAPDAIPVPEALRHRRVELILWPLDEPAEIAPAAPDYERSRITGIEMPSREERNARR